MNSQDESVARGTHHFVWMALPGLHYLENQKLSFEVYKSIHNNVKISVTNMIHQSSEIHPPATSQPVTASKTLFPLLLGILFTIAQRPQRELKRYLPSLISNVNTVSWVKG